VSIPHITLLRNILLFVTKLLHTSKLYKTSKDMSTISIIYHKKGAVNKLHGWAPQETPGATPCSCNYEKMPFF